MDALRAYLRRHLRFALGRFSGWIRRLTVRVAGVSRPRRGVEKECRIAVDLVPRGRIVLIERTPDLHVAVDRGLDRLGRAVARRVERGRPVEFGRRH